MRCSIAISAALAALVPAASARAAAVDFQILSQDVTVDRTAHVAEFTVTFSRAPIFVTADSGDADAFQYEIDADSTDLSRDLELNEIDVVVRGGEIWEGRGIPVRQPTGGGGEGPEAGGWGPVRALLPFELNDKTLTFSAPLNTLGATDGTFRYRAFSIDEGGMTGRIVGAVVPTPAAIGPGLVLLGGLLILRATRRRII